MRYKTLNQRRTTDVIYDKISNKYLFIHGKEIIKSFVDKKTAYDYHNKIAMGELINTMLHNGHEVFKVSL